jgi:hypothetical protein
MANPSNGLTAEALRVACPNASDRAEAVPAVADIIAESIIRNHGLLFARRGQERQCGHAEVLGNARRCALLEEG